MTAAHIAISDQTVKEALDGLTAMICCKLLDVSLGNYGLSPSNASFAIHCMVANHYFEEGLIRRGQPNSRDASFPRFVHRRAL